MPNLDMTSFHTNGAEQSPRRRRPLSRPRTQLAAARRLSFLGRSEACCGRCCAPPGPGAISLASLPRSAAPRRCGTLWRLADWAGKFFHALAGEAEDGLALGAPFEGDWARCPRAVEYRRWGSATIAVDVLTATRLTSPTPSPPPSAPCRMSCASRSSGAVASRLRRRIVSVARCLWQLFGRGEKWRAIKVTPRAAAPLRSAICPCLAGITGFRAFSY